MGDVTRRQAMVGAIQQLTAKGDTGLYDTILAAYLAMQQAWRPNAQNVLVVITVGKNEDANGISLQQLLEKLKAANRADHPLYVIGIAVGPEADAEALDQITKVTDGRTIVARDELSAIQQIVLAFAGRLS
jgi:Mg-chelatase subunit ChlD